jgi:Cu+-exporting ATPase
MTGENHQNKGSGLIFHVKGMNCVSCATVVQLTVKKLNGVKKVSVNPVTEIMTVAHDEGFDGEDLKSALAEKGYEITPRNFSRSDNGRQVHSHGDETGHDHHKILKEAEIGQLKRNWIIGAILSFGIVILGLPDYFPTINFLPFGVRMAALVVLAGLVEFWVGYQFWRSAFYGLRNFSVNMDTLVVLGTGVTFFWSSAVAVIQFLGWQGGFKLDSYFDVPAVVTTLVVLGKYLEARAKGAASDSIKKLFGLQAKVARLIKPDGLVEEVAVSEIKVGDRLLIRPGEKVPVDGTVIDGVSHLDESLVSGESMPVSKKTGDLVIGATVNGDGVFQMRAEKIGQDTFLANVIRMVEEAQASKAPIQNLADKVVGYFVPVVLLVSVFSFAIWFFVGPAPAFQHAIVAAVAVLVVACPCALGLATPTSIVVGTGLAALQGIIIRDAEALELAGKVDTVIFDKTGTLTEGKPAVTDIIAVNSDFTKGEILSLAASLEKFSEHPIARAIETKSEELKSAIGRASEVKIFAGKGLSGLVKTASGEILVTVGNLASVEEVSATVPAILSPRVTEFEEQGKTVLFVSVSGRVVGLVAVADTPKKGARQAVQLLRSLGLSVAMITGDNQKTASAIGREVGIMSVIAKVLPGQKVEKVRELKNAGHLVAMVGDGINDAPALTEATVGIAIGTGTDIAAEASGITLVSGNPVGVYQAIKVSRATLGNVRQNLFFAFIYNLILIPVAAGALFGPFGILLNPILAGGAMALSSVSVVLNALRLRLAVIK